MNLARFALIGLLCVVQLLPGATASANAIQVTSLQAEGGHATGGLVAASRTELVIDELQFHLEAGSLRVEVDHSDLAIDPGTGAVVLNPETDTMSLANVVMTPAGNRDGATLYLFPLDGAVLSSDLACQDWSDASGAAERPPFVATRQERPTFTASLDAAVQWRPCAQGPATITGSFVMAFWEADAKIRTTGGENVVWSGSKPTVYDQVTERQDVFFFIEDGTLEFPFAHGLDVFVDSSAASLQGASRLMFHGAHAELALGGQTVSAQGDDLELTGDLTAHWSSNPTDARMSIALDGEIESAKVNGQLATVLVPASSSYAGVWITVAVALVVLLAGASQWSLLRGRRVARLWGSQTVSAPRARALYWATLSEGLAFRGWLRLSAWSARHAARCDPSSPEALTARAHIEFEQRRFGKQLATHQQLATLLVEPAELATNAIQAARALVHLHRQEEAIEWLKEAEKVDSHLVAQHMGHADFAALRNHPLARHRVTEPTYGYA